MPIKTPNVASAWIAKLRFEPEEKVRLFEEDMRGTTEALVAMESIPFENQTSACIASKLECISKALSKTAEELHFLKAYQGQDLEKFPVDMPVLLAIENAYLEQCNEDRKAPELGLCFVTSRVEKIEELLVCVERAQKNMSRRGNSLLRKREAKIKSDLSKNFVFKYRSTFGHYPTQRKDVIEVLGWVFRLAKLTESNADGCLRTAIENDQNGLGGKGSEIVQSMIQSSKKSNNKAD